MINKFAERVVGLLQEKGITKYKLAMDTGISKSVLSDYCNGKVQPTADVIITVAKYFDVSADYILGLTNDFE